MSVNAVCGLLAAQYGEPGRAAGERLRHWLSGSVPYAHPEILGQHLSEEHVPLLFDAFWTVLPFGTGGRRGRVGYGSNRMNESTVALTTQGHCDYLHAVFPERTELTVVVANDVRVFRDIAGTYSFLGSDHPLLGVSSRSLARLACEVYAANGIVAYIQEPAADMALLSTPELSYLIVRLEAIGGVNLSASHNFPDDNGVKVYDHYGSQPIAPDDQRLVDAAEAAAGIRAMDFQQAVREGMIRDIPAGLHEDYLGAYVKLYGRVYPPREDVPIVYTPLCGCGLSTAGDLLSRLGFPFTVPPGQGPDGSFAAIPLRSPNPEVPQATEPAMAFADQDGCGLVLSSDPDADRVGVEANLPDGSWHHFNGHQIATILCYFLMLDPEGPQRRGLVIETLVTTRLLGRIVERAGDSCLVDDLPVGFKYIANVLKSLEREGRYGAITGSPDQLVLAAEESHGAIVLPTIRDKDSAPACMYFAALYQRLWQEGRTLLDYYVRILEEFAHPGEADRSIVLSGAEGVSKRSELVAWLRESPPEMLGGQVVRRVVDRWDEAEFGPFVSETDKLPRNLMQFHMDPFTVTVRPSGTEPKLKFYCQLQPDNTIRSLRGTELLRAVTENADAVARAVYNDLLAGIGMHLTEAGLRLPDLIDLDRKQVFEERTVPSLREALTARRFARLDDLLAWLRQEVSEMMPGVDALPAVRSSVAYLCEQWASELAAARLLTELAHWARS
jgi:phosphoglucomutase